MGKDKNEVIGKKKELEISEGELEKELLEFSLEDIDISLDDINLDDIEEDLDFEFENLNDGNFNKFENKVQTVLDERKDSQDYGERKDFISENITELEKTNMDSVLSEDTSNTVSEENFDMDSLLSEDTSNTVSEESFDMDGLLSEDTSNTVSEEGFDMDSLLSEDTSNTVLEEGFDMDSLLSEDTSNTVSEEGFDMDSLLSEDTSNTVSEEGFDMDSLLSEDTSNTVSEEGFDMDSLLSEDTSNTVSEEGFDMGSLLSEEISNDMSEESLSDSGNMEGFSFDGLFGNDLEFSDSSKEGQDINLDNLSEVLDSSVLDAMPDAEEIVAAEEKEEKKRGLFARLFGNVKDDKWEKQKALEAQKEEEKRLKEEEKKKVEEEAAEGEKELTKEEKKAAKKAEKEAKKAAKKAAKEQAKKEKEAQKKEVVEEVIEDEGRINKVGASIVFVFFGACAIAVVVGTNIFSYNQSIKNATNLFDIKKYTQAYDQIRGVKIKSKDEEIYNKIMTVMYVDKQLNSYNNYYGIELYPEALDSLLKGLDKYDKHLYEAKQLGIKSDFDYIKEEILTQLGDTFEVSEQEAYDIIDMENKAEYSEKVRKIANGEE